MSALTKLIEKGGLDSQATTPAPLAIQGQITDRTVATVAAQPGGQLISPPDSLQRMRQ